MFAALAALTGLFVVGQSIARQVQLDAADHPALRALGMTSGQLVAAVLLRGALVGVGGALLATAMAVLLSPLTPIGLARRAEVDPGVAVDAPVLVLGAAGLLLFVLARTGLAGWAATRASGAVQGRQPAVRRPSRVGDGLAGAGGPPSAVIGTRLAFESGQGAAALPARTAAVGAVVAVAAVTAALTFGSSLGHLAGAPALQGWAGDAIVGNPRGRLRQPGPGGAPPGRQPAGGRLLVPHHPGRAGHPGRRGGRWSRSGSTRSRGRCCRRPSRGARCARPTSSPSAR